MSSFTVKPNPTHLIKDGSLLTTDVVKIFDLKEKGAPPISLCHLEILTASYKLNGLNKNNPPSYDPDLATQAQILLEELNFQNHYNVDTGHAVRLDIFSRDDQNEDWNLETSKMVYRTGLYMTNLDILYPYLVNTNVWLCNSTTELGVKLLISPTVTLRGDDFLSIRAGLVVKSDFEPLTVYSPPAVYNVTTAPQIIDIDVERRKVSLHTPTTNPSSIFLRFGDTVGLGVGQYHLELPPGYNNPVFEVTSRQVVTAASPQPCQLVVG